MMLGVCFMMLTVSDAQEISNEQIEYTRNSEINRSSKLQ